jgi:hypothetical protein
VHVLYSKNTFSFGSSNRKFDSQPKLEPVMFPRLFLPHHFNLITSLDMHINVQETSFIGRRDALSALPYFNFEEYNNWWAILASMARLRSLTVSLNIYLMPPLTDKVCSTVLDPILAMRNCSSLREFHLAMPETVFRIFRQCEDPPYTTISFWRDVRTLKYASSALWNDPPYEQDGEYFPILDTEDP